ncbi:hypothetical protein B296_00018472 [Ensete ventricosum]|uniref:Uncharacterized protein n=1 Tax=Ensete ventricosum TaxID=4639 RepID=A0A426ZSE9_ENSVE|nr:hypothetical protein B296_00018472 [Ensete ventricosum]
MSSPSNDFIPQEQGRPHWAPPRCNAPRSAEPCQPPVLRRVSPPNGVAPMLWNCALLHGGPRTQAVAFALIFASACVFPPEEEEEETKKVAV